MIAAQSKEKDIRLTMTINDFLQTVLYTERNLQSVFFVLPDETFQSLTKNNVALDYQYQYPRGEWKEQTKLNRNWPQLFSDAQAGLFSWSYGSSDDVWPQPYGCTGVEDNQGVFHLIRKTWGYHLYAQNPMNLAFLMEMFNHEKQTTTLRYLGLTQGAMDKAILSLS